MCVWVGGWVGVSGVYNVVECVYDVVNSDLRDPYTTTTPRGPLDSIQHFSETRSLLMEI